MDITPNLKLLLYDRDSNIIDSTSYIVNNVGKVVIPELTPNTQYNQGEFFVSWVVGGAEMNKSPVPAFKTLKYETSETVMVYFNDINKDTLERIQGDSAYQIWLKHGNHGTENDFLQSLKGEKGDQGEKGDKGDSGLNLTQGGSAYEYALENGFEGTEKEWLESLKGEKGDQGEKGESGKSAYQLYVDNFDFQGDIGDFFNALKGEKGEKGDQGEKGIQGEQGIQGEKGETPTLPDFSNWQKYKLVSDNGNQITNFNSNNRMTNENLLSTKPGFYYNYEYNDSPSGATGFVYITENASGDKKIYYSSYNHNDLYIKTYTESTGWIEWEKASNDYNDTGWLPLTLKNDYKKSTIPDFDPSYRVVYNGDFKQVYVRLGVENLTNGKNVVATIPSEFTPNKIYSLGASTIAKIPPKVVIYNGDIEFHTNEKDSYLSTDYIIYQDSWIV